MKNIVKFITLVVLFAVFFTSCEKDTFRRDTNVLVNKGWCKSSIGVEYENEYSQKRVLYFGENGNYSEFELRYNSVLYDEGDFSYNDTNWVIYRRTTADWNWSDVKISSINLYSDYSEEIYMEIDIVEVSRNELIIMEYYYGYYNNEIHYQKNNELYEAIKEYYDNNY